MRIDQTYQKELIKVLTKSPSLKEEITLLKTLHKGAKFWIVSASNKLEQARNLQNEIISLNGKAICKAAKGQRIQCLKCLNTALVRSKKTQSTEQFYCPNHSYNVCIPLVQGNAFYGFLIICDLGSPLNPEAMLFLQTLHKTILEAAQKELELFKLYQSIRPRAVALSTIHTVHRLISSSLNIDELLPRIGRLSLQVLRAKKCLIALMDKETNRLVHKAFIDLNKKRTNVRPNRTMMNIEKKVLRAGNVSLKKAYLSVPLIDEELIGVITVFKGAGKKQFNNFDQEILSALSEQAVVAIKNAQLYKEQENMLLGTVKSLSRLLKVKCAHPYAHSQSFVNIVLGLAKQLKVSDEELRNLRFAAMLHDAEKIGIPEEILKKPTELSGREIEIVKAHPKKGAKILSPLARLKPVISIILHHHENFDGSGYPDRWSGAKIPLGAKIMAVAESFEAMISRRPYRKSTPISQAIQELKRHSGTQFAPNVIQAFLRFVKTKSFKKIIKK